MAGRSIALGRRCRTCLNRKCIRYSIPKFVFLGILSSLCRPFINERRLIEMAFLCRSISIPFFRYSFLWSQIGRWSVLSLPFVSRLDPPEGLELASLMGKRAEEGEPKEGLSLPHKLLDSMAKAYFLWRILGEGGGVGWGGRAQLRAITYRTRIHHLLVFQE